MMTILDNIKDMFSNDEYEDSKMKLLEETKKQFLGAVSPREMSKLIARSEGQTEWDRRKALANDKCGKIGDFDFSQIFKVFEMSANEAVEAVETRSGPSLGSPPPPPLPPIQPQASNQTQAIGKRLKKLHWDVLPVNQTKGDTIWSSSSKVDWDKVEPRRLQISQTVKHLDLLHPPVH